MLLKLRSLNICVAMLITFGLLINWEISKGRCSGGAALSTKNTVCYISGSNNNEVFQFFISETNLPLTVDNGINLSKYQNKDHCHLKYSLNYF